MRWRGHTGRYARAAEPPAALDVRYGTPRPPAGTAACTFRPVSPRPILLNGRRHLGRGEARARRDAGRPRDPEAYQSVGRRVSRTGCARPVRCIAAP